MTSNETTLEFVGHATFVVRHGGSSLVLDPYPPGDFSEALGLRAIVEEYDWWVSSHGHVDHDGGDSLPGPPRRWADDAPFRVTRVPSVHDEYGGRRRGGAVDLLIVDIGDVRVVHASDIGRSPSPETLEKLGEVDVLLVPVGGFYTVGAAQAWEWCLRCSPGTVVPMHYATGSTRLPLRGLDGFLAVATWPVEQTQTLDLLELEDGARILLMEPTRADSHLSS